MKKLTFLLPPPPPEKQSWGLRYLLFSAVFLPRLLTLLRQILLLPFGPAEWNFLFYLISMAAVVLIFGSYLVSSLKAACQIPLRTLSAGIACFLAYWLANFLMGLFISRVFPDFSNVNDGAIGALTEENFPLMFLCTIVFAPITEECLYRTVLFRGFYDRSPAVAYVISTLAFCSIHVFNFWGMAEPLTLAVCFVQYIPAGICLAASYRLGGSIVVPILIHAAVNTVGIIAMR